MCWGGELLPGIQSWSFSTVVAMFLCWTLQRMTSSIWLDTLHKRQKNHLCVSTYQVSLKNLLEIYRLPLVRRLGVSCWCRLPDPKKKQNMGGSGYPSMSLWSDRARRRVRNKAGIWTRGRRRALERDNRLWQVVLTDSATNFGDSARDFWTLAAPPALSSNSNPRPNWPLVPSWWPQWALCAAHCPGRVERRGGLGGCIFDN